MKKHKHFRRERAEARAAEVQNMTPAQRLARLDARLGVGVGAAKERLKWQKRDEHLKAASSK